VKPAQPLEARLELGSSFAGGRVPGLEVAEDFRDLLGGMRLRILQLRVSVERVGLEKSGDGLPVDAV
jgi:hypothetical protein